MTYKEWNDIRFKVFAKSLHDPDFRALCLSNPLEAVKQATGVDLPPDTKLSFVEKNEDFIYCYKLPPLQDAAATIQSEEDALIRWATECTELPTG